MSLWGILYPDHKTILSHQRLCLDDCSRFLVVSGLPVLTACYFSIWIHMAGLLISLTFKMFLIETVYNRMQPKLHNITTTKPTNQPDKQKTQNTMAQANFRINFILWLNIPKGCFTLLVIKAGSLAISPLQQVWWGKQKQENTSKS